MKKHKESASVLFHNAKALEDQQSYAEAAKEYARILQINPLHIDAANRLMMVYRKLKAYAKELAVIDKAIAAHEKDSESKQREWIKSHQKVADRTRSLAQSLGLLSESGLPIYENELLEKWKRRKKIVEGRLQKEN